MPRDNADNVTLKAALFDQQQRLEILEAMFFGQAKRPLELERLLSLYTEACKREQPTNQITAGLWCSVLLSLGVSSLLQIARATRDYAPWKTFLLLLERYKSAGFDVEEATRHMLDLARGLLDAQGLGILAPEDFLGSPPAIYRALGAISLR